MIRRPPRSTRVRSSAASDVYKRQSFPSIPSSLCHSFPTSCPHNLFDRSLHHALISLPPLPSSVSIPYPAKCPSIVHERFKTASSENKIIINRQASKPQSLRVPRRDSRSVMNLIANYALNKISHHAMREMCGTGVAGKNVSPRRKQTHPDDTRHRPGRGRL